MSSRCVLYGRQQSMLTLMVGDFSRSFLHYSGILIENGQNCSSRDFCMKDRTTMNIIS
jgi:hypothetical protein